MNWQSPIPTAAAYKRAGGRRKANAQRRADRFKRQKRLLELLQNYLKAGGKLTDKGLKTSMAAELGVAKSTVTGYWKYMSERQWLNLLQLRSTGVKVDVSEWNC